MEQAFYLSDKGIKQEIRKKHPKFGLADAIHLATAQQEKAIFVTADNDFTGVENVMVI